MSGWLRHRGSVAHWPMDNIDTDQLIPARFMSTSRTDGYGNYLLHDVRDRFDVTKGNSIVLAGRNFGSGSSREAAVYALVDFGIRAVLAPGFADIFASNAVNNGLLPARVAQDDLERLRRDGGDVMSIDLETQTVTGGDVAVSFDIDPTWRLKMLNGWDDIDLTQRHSDEISAFADARRRALGWAWPEDAQATGASS